MLKNALKSTSVVALCTALMTPPVLAQDAEETLENCSVTGPFPCVMEDGTRVENAMELAKESLLPGNDNADEQAENAPQAPETPAEPSTPTAPGEEVAEDAPAADAQAEAEADVQAEAEAEAEADDGGLVENLANDLVDAGEEAADTVQETAEQAGDAVEETTEEAADAVEETAEDAADTAEATADAAEEEAGDAAQELAEELPADENVEAEAEATAEAEADAAADEGELADALEEDANAEAEATAEADAEASDEEMTAGERIEEDTSAETAQAPSAPEEPQEDQAPEAAAAADAEATDEEMASDEDVVVEEVTEAEARSSSEEFQTTATVTEEAAANTNGGNNNGTGLNRQLTDFEKLVLAGLGGVAVGTILANGREIVSNSGDRIVVQNPDGTYRVLKNDDQILRQPGVVLSTKSYDDGSTRTVVERENGVRIVTIRAADGTVLKRTRVLPNGDQYVLFDDTVEAQPVSQQDVQDYEPVEDIRASSQDEEALRAALMASMDRDPGRSYSLRQVRQYSGVRDLAPVIQVDAITFDTGSAVIRAGQAEELAALGQAINSVIEERPDAVFLIEGHTDAVGGAAYNLALSDRRAESVALALTEYFDVPPENMVTQGYGESELKIVTAEAERENRRANVRNITALLQ
ncbi:MAG: OmpA family protein [Pseudomonadota bacterium]|nr:OmpA family protein [Pseudomonadota bacterium]